MTGSLSLQAETSQFARRACVVDTVTPCLECPCRNELNPAQPIIVCESPTPLPLFAQHTHLIQLPLQLTERSATAHLFGFAAFAAKRMEEGEKNVGGA